MSTKNKSDANDICKRSKMKPFNKLPITSPWRSRAPFFKPNNMHKRILARNPFAFNTNKNKSPKMNIVTETIPTQPKKVDQTKSAEVYPEITNESKKKEMTNPSSTQFQYFMRLMQLFPMIHPAYIHSVLTQCNNDFMRTIDNLLRTRQSRIPQPMTRKFGPPLQFYQKMPPNNPTISRYIPGMPIVKINGMNGMNGMNGLNGVNGVNGFNGLNGMNPQMYRQFNNFRLQYPTILPKPSVRNMQQFGVQKVDDVPVIKVERKDPST